MLLIRAASFREIEGMVHQLGGSPSLLFKLIDKGFVAFFLCKSNCEGKLAGNKEQEFFYVLFCLLRKWSILEIRSQYQAKLIPFPDVPRTVLRS